MSSGTILKNIFSGGGVILEDYILRSKTLRCIIISIRCRYSRQERHFTKTESPKICFQTYLKEIRTIVPKTFSTFPLMKCFHYIVQLSSNPNDQVGVTRPLTCREGVLGTHFLKGTSKHLMPQSVDC